MSETKKRRSRKAAEDSNAVVETMIATEEITAETVVEETADVAETTLEVIEQVSEPVTELPPVENTDAVQDTAVVKSAPAKKSKKDKVESKSSAKSGKFIIGTEIQLTDDIHNPARLYFRNDSRKFIRYIAGTVYVWGDIANNRVPVATDKDLVGNANGLIGWVDVTAVKE